MTPCSFISFSLSSPDNVKIQGQEMVPALRFRPGFGRPSREDPSSPFLSSLPVYFSLWCQVTAILTQHTDARAEEPRKNGSPEGKERIGQRADISFPFWWRLSFLSSHGPRGDPTLVLPGPVSSSAMLSFSLPFCLRRKSKAKHGGTFWGMRRLLRETGHTARKGLQDCQAKCFW